DVCLVTMRKRKPDRLTRFRKKSRPSRPVKLAVEPGAGVHPVALGRSGGDPQGLGGVAQGEAAEVAELDQPRFERIFALELPQGFVEREQVVRLILLRFGEQAAGVELDAPELAAPLVTLLAPRLLDEDPPHGLRGRSEEVAAAVPWLGLIHVHEPDVGLMDQGRGLECLAGLFLGELLGRQLAQLVIDQRQKLLGGVRIALLDGRQDAGDIAHARKYSGQGSAHPCGAKRPGWSRSNATKVARRHIGGGGGMSALELFPAQPAPARTCARRSDTRMALIHDPVEGVRSVVVGWVESSRPTGTARGSVGLEDSTHPTDFGPDTVNPIRNQSDLTSQTRSPGP